MICNVKKIGFCFGMAKNKRVLFLTPTLNVGGAERQMVTVAVHLKQMGVDVEFLVYSNEDFYSSVLSANNIKVHWRNLPSHFDRIIKVRQFIRRGSYDVVISFLEVANFLNNISVLGFKKKRWKVITGERSSHEKIFKGIRGKLFCSFMRLSDCIVCNSNVARQMWLSHYPKYKDKLKVIYNTVEISKVSSEYVPKINGRLNIVVAATLYSIKNPVNVVKALMLMSDEERQKIHIDWYGRVPTINTFDNQKAYKDTIHLIKQNGLEDTLCIHEPTDRIHDKMNEADVVALFSFLEGLPNTIVEGMALGKPIIMSHVSDYDVLVDDSNGFLCNQADPLSIKETILKAADLQIVRLIEMGEMSKKKSDCLFADKVNDMIWLDLLGV